MRYFFRFNFLLIFLLLYACAPQSQDLAQGATDKPTITPKTQTKQRTDRKTVSSEQAQSPLSQKLAGEDFYFSPLDSSWILVSDLNNTAIPLEFYQPSSSTRISFNISSFDKNSEPNISDLVSSILQARENTSDKVVYAKSGHTNINQINGMGWELAWERQGTFFQQMGVYAVAENKLVHGQLFVRQDSLIERNLLQKKWQDFFSHLTIEESIGEIPSLDKDITQKITSEKFGYTWKTTDKLWHVFNKNKFDEASALLMNQSEELSLSIMAVQTDLQEVSLHDVFKIMLMRTGLAPNTPQIKIGGFKKNSRGGYSKDFQVIHEINGFDFVYRGVFHFENGRAVLATVWSQHALDKKYANAAHNALKTLNLHPKYKSPPLTPEKNAQLLNQIGLLRLLEEQPLVALSYFERANRMDPQEALYLINCGFVYQLQNLYGPGVAHFETQLTLVEKNVKLLYILGEMYEALRDYGLALKYYEMAMEYTPNDPELVINLSDALWGVGQRNKSLAVVKNLYDSQPSVRLGVYVAKTLMGMDQYSEAVDLLYDVRQKFPMNRSLGLTLCDALIFLQRYAEALNISQEMLATHEKDWEFLTTRGKILFHLHQYAFAESTLEKSLRINKDNEEARSYLSATKAFLGKADNRALQTKIAPALASPQNLSALRDAAFARTAKEEASAVIHWQSEALKIEKNGKWVQTEEMLAEIIAPGGVSVFQEFTFNFLPGYDRIYINTLNIYDQNFKIRKKWSPNEAYITYFKEKGTNTDAQRAHLPLKDLKVGDIIHLQVSRTAVENSSTIPFIHHVASRNIPVKKDEFRLLTANTDLVIFDDYGPMEKEVKADGIYWHTDEPVVIHNEKFMPLYQDFGAGVYVTTKQEWESVGKNYYALIKHQFKNSIPVREKAFEIKGNKTVDENLIYETADWIRGNINYRAVEFGGHSLIPSLSLTTLNNRNGDCKDQSLLLLELLNTMGVKANLALINLDEPGSMALPTIQQFNHMIVHVPAGERWPEMWIDPTDKSSSKRPVPLDLEDRVSIVINADSSFVRITPTLEKDQEHAADLQHQIFIAPSGKAEFKDEIILRGKFASALRNEMLKRDQLERKKYFQAWIGQNIPDAVVVDVQVENVQAFNRALTIKMIYSSENYFLRSANDIQGPLPNIWENAFMYLPSMKNRKHPIRLPHETLFKYSMEVTALGKEKISLEKPQTSTEQYYTKQQFNLQSNNAKSIKYTGSWQTHSTYADPAEYLALVDEWNTIVENTSLRLRLLP